MLKVLGNGNELTGKFFLPVPNSERDFFIGDKTFNFPRGLI